MPVTFPIDLNDVAPGVTLSPELAAEKAAIVGAMQSHRDTPISHGTAAEVRARYQSRLALAGRTNGFLQAMLQTSIDNQFRASINGTIANNDATITKLKHRLETLAHAPAGNVVAYHEV